MPCSHAQIVGAGAVTQVLENVLLEKIIRSTPTQLLFRKKITAVFADNSSKINLGIATVVRMLQGAANVPVEVAAGAAARELLDDLALSAGRTVERASAGTFLTSPAKQPDREPQAVPVVPTAPVWS